MRGKRRTVGSRVQNDEASINRRAFAVVLPHHRICVAAQSFLFFKKMHLMLGITEGKQGTQARYAAADNSYTLFSRLVAHGELVRKRNGYTSRLEFYAGYMYHNDRRERAERV